MTIERTRTLLGNVLYEVWHNDDVLACFDSYCDAVDFVRFFEEL